MEKVYKVYKRIWHGNYFLKKEFYGECTLFTFNKIVNDFHYSFGFYIIYGHLEIFIDIQKKNSGTELSLAEFMIGN